MLTSLNVLMPAGSAASGEATEEEEEAAEEGGATQKVHACHALLGFLRVSNRGYNPVFIFSRTLFYSHYG